jgi:7-cyano-7-deazaguanine synthase
MRPIILLSGGLDSAIMLHHAINQGLNPIALNIIWGQPNWDLEASAARRQCDGRAQLITASICFPVTPMAAGVGAPGPRVVPGRNLAFIATAIPYAVAHGCDVVWLGATGEDQADYPDCRPAFIAAADALTRSIASVGVSAPLIGLDGPALRAMAARLGVDRAATWSCYQPSGASPCGTCAACIRRAV